MLDLVSQNNRPFLESKLGALLTVGAGAVADYYPTMTSLRGISHHSGVPWSASRLGQSGCSITALMRHTDSATGSQTASYTGVSTSN